MKTGAIFLQVVGLVVLGFALITGINSGDMNLPIVLFGLMLVIGGLIIIIYDNKRNIGPRQ